jgi:hypothetical protein
LQETAAKVAAAAPACNEHKYESESGDDAAWEQIKKKCEEPGYEFNVQLQ